MYSGKIEIPVMFCFDNNYVIPAGVAFYSLLENANKDYIYKFFVLHTDITDENQEKLQKTIEEFSSFSTLEFINLENRFIDVWERIAIKGHFSKEVMYKVLVASIFPQYEKIIVSDVDVVFLNDISQSYFDLDVSEDYYLAGVKMIGKMLWYMDVYKESFTNEEIEKLSGFCGGYIVFNLKKLRDDNMEEKFIDCFINEGYRINQMEQDVLNLCCYPKTKSLKLKYVACSYMWDIYKTDEDMSTDSNYSKEEILDAMQNTVQLHYATSTKPWKNVDSTKSEIWFKYIVKTPFLKEYLSKLPRTMVIPKRDRKEVNNGINNKLSDNENKVSKIFNYFRNNPFFFLNYKFYKKLFKKIKNRISKNFTALIIIDDVFPSKLSPFRYEEYIAYFKKFRNVFTLSTGTSLPALKEYSGVNCVIEKFEETYPKYKGRVINYKLNDMKINEKIGSFLYYYKKRLALITFIQNAINDEYNNIDFLEKHEIPFIITIYPGGGFRLNDSNSDEKLRRIFSSNCFRKVIVTQQITYDYLLKNNFCNKEDIEFIYGIVTPKKLLNAKVKNKKNFGYNKKNLDICFVAHKYCNKGIDKGYDLFIETAKKLVKKYSNIYFHVVGGFDEKEIDVSEIKDHIRFYGIRDSKWFVNFYKDKDIILSPNRPFILGDGAFDGFPTGSCTDAMLNNVGLFCTDELKLNCKFEDKRDLVIIKPDANEIVKEIEYYYNNPYELKKISDNGRILVKENYSYNKQILPRIKTIKKVIKKMK